MMLHEVEVHVSHARYLTFSRGISADVYFARVAILDICHRWFSLVEEGRESERETVREGERKGRDSENAELELRGKA